MSGTGLRAAGFPASEGILARDGSLPPQVVLGLWQCDDEAAAPLCLADAAGQLIYANGAYQRIAPHLANQGGQPSLAEVAASIEALGRPLRQDHVFRIDDRYECYISERMVVRDGSGNPFAVMSRFVPVDEVRRLEVALALAEDRLDDVTRLVADWVWETDAALKLTFVSHRVLDRLGYHPREMTGRPLAEFAGEGLLQADGPLGRYRPLRDVPVEISHKERGRRTFLVSAVPVYDVESGDFRGYRGTAHDVTEREAQKAALIKAVDHAEAASRAKTDFLANMSHELRTPLNAIMGFSEVMSLEVMGPLGQSRYREYAEDILTSSRHLLKLINDILDIAKIEAGRLDLEEAELRPAELLGVVQRLIAKQAERAGVSVLIDILGEPPRLYADERRLKQVLLNLVSNAIKFSHAGGAVTVRVSAAAGGGLDFAVIDTGIGIPADQIEVAMAPFSQLDTGLGRRFEGTGLGLPLSKALTELHGGILDLKSTPGVGTTVTVRLPAHRVLRPEQP